MRLRLKRNFMPVVSMTKYPQSYHVEEIFYVYGAIDWELITGTSREAKAPLSIWFPRPTLPNYISIIPWWTVRSKNTDLTSLFSHVGESVKEGHISLNCDQELVRFMGILTSWMLTFCGMALNLVTCESGRSGSSKGPHEKFVVQVWEKTSGRRREKAEPALNFSFDSTVMQIIVGSQQC